MKVSLIWSLWNHTYEYVHLITKYRICSSRLPKEKVEEEREREREGIFSIWQS